MRAKDGLRKIRNETAYGTVTEERLRALLDHDIENDGIVMLRGNKIGRKHYAKLLGCSFSAMTKFGDVFEEYELKPGVEKEDEKRISEMCVWIKAEYKARNFEIRGKKLDRSRWRRHFRLDQNAFISSDNVINLLFKVLDTRAVHEGYVSNKKQEELTRIRRILNEVVPLTRTRMAINIEELSRLSGVSERRIRSNPIAELVAVRNAEIMAEVKASKIDPYIHRRVYPFSHLTSHWSKEFLERLGVRFKQIKAGYAEQSVKPSYLKFVAALDWIGSSSNPNCIAVVVEANTVGRVLSGDAWEDALFAYRDHIIATAKSDNYASESITLLGPTLEGMSSKGILPSLTVSLPGIKRDRRQKGHLRSVAEVSSNAGKKDSEKYIEFASDYYHETCKGLNSKVGEVGSAEFLHSIGAELALTNDLPVDPAAAILRILERRLDALRNRSVTILDDAIKNYLKGKRLISSANIDLAEFDKLSSDLSLSAYEWQKFVSKTFSGKNSKNGDVEQGLSNLLQLINERYSGIPPAENDMRPEYHSQFFRKRYQKYGGVGKIVPLLHPNVDAVCAALTLYLIESGSNVTVGRTLDRDCMEPSDMEGYFRITGHKARAKGKPIIIDLPESSNAVRAIEWILSAGASLQSNAMNDNDRLFLVRKGGESQLVTQAVFTYWFKGMSQSTDGLMGVELTPNMIRPSVMLHANLTNDGRLAAGMALGQHGQTVALGYQQKWPSRLSYDQKIRRFQEAFESVAMSGIDGAAKKLGITRKEFESRLGNLRETGLGTFCLDSRGRSGESSGQCSTLDCWNNCPHLLVVAEVECIATLQLWQSSLRSVQPEWERDRPERWDQVWLPWLCLTDVVEEKMARGPLLKVWTAAVKRAAELSSRLDYVPPRPW